MFCQQDILFLSKDVIETALKSSHSINPLLTVQIEV